MHAERAPRETITITGTSKQACEIMVAISQNASTKDLTLPAFKTY